MKTIKVSDAVGDFAGDKDEARSLRQRELEPAMRSGQELELDFGGVELATQSFLHALVSDLVRSTDFNALALITFTNCNDSVRELVEIVVKYSQENVAADVPHDESG